MKVILEKLNQEFKGRHYLKNIHSNRENEGNGSNVKIDAYSHDPLRCRSPSIPRPRKTLTVGSLKQR